MATTSVRDFDAVIFDLFGTLIPTGSRASREKHLAEMAPALGVDPSGFSDRFFRTFPERMLGATGSLEDTVTRFATEMGHPPDAGSLRRAADIRMAYHAGLLEAGQLSLPALEVLKRRGLRLAVLTNCSDEVTRLWSSCALAPLFDVVVFSCREGVGKPDPRAYRTVLDRLNLPADRCVFVGDRDGRELPGASAVGLRVFRYFFPEGERYHVQSAAEWNGPTLGSLDELCRVGP